MPLSLAERLAELSDPRDRRGRQYPLVGLLTLCLLAVLAGHTGPEAIAQFGRLRQKRPGHALGFKNGNVPCANTIAAVLRGLDADHLDRITAAWPADRHAEGWEQIALDGKRVCGSRDGEAPGTHPLAADAPQASAVIPQVTVEATTNEHKAAPPIAGRVALARWSGGHCWCHVHPRRRVRGGPAEPGRLHPLREGQPVPVAGRPGNRLCRRGRRVFPPGFVRHGLSRRAWRPTRARVTGGESGGR